MKILIDEKKLARIQKIGEAAYPEEAAGFILGFANNDDRLVEDIYEVLNSKKEGERHNRYLITAKEFLNGELAAEKKNLELIGVFHSHPDHPDHPSEFDREWAMPWFSYVITSVQNGKAVSSRSWRLNDDRSSFIEEKIITKVLENGEISK